MKTKQKSKINIFKQAKTYFALALIIPAIVLCVQLYILDTLPTLYFSLIIIGVILVSGLFTWLQYYKNLNKVNRILIRIMIVLISIGLIFANLYVYQGLSMLNRISSNDKQHDTISVIVLKENKAEKIKDVKDEIFATSKLDQKLTNLTVTAINKDLDKEIETKEYKNLDDQASALMDKSVNVIIMNEAYRSLLDENHPTFDKDTKVIYQHKIEKAKKKLGMAVDVTKDPFNVYISGVDTYGDIGTQARSDVNIIATVNPNTKEILLTSVPRDYYIKQTCQGNQNDKLTHTGIFGVDCTIESMQNFTNLTMNYYLRVNFSSLEDIVNALGGIDIYNEIGFYSGVDGSFIPGGDIHMNGSTALKFSRERHAYADGDRQRGRNQMIVIDAIIAKAISPAILGGYSSVMGTVAESFETNLESGDITSLVKKQLGEKDGWTVTQQSFTGSGESGVWSPANGFNSYVMYPDQTSVDEGLAKIHELLNK